MAGPFWTGGHRDRTGDGWSLHTNELQAKQVRDSQNAGCDQGYIQTPSKLRTPWRFLRATSVIDLPHQLSFGVFERFCRLARHGIEDSKGSCAREHFSFELTQASLLGKRFERS